MKEKDFQTKFTNWAKEHWTGGSACFELKFVKEGHRLNFKSDIKDHQLRALRLASKGRLVWKIEDAGYLQKPFDTFVLEKVPAYIVVMFEEKKDRFFLLTIQQIDALIKNGYKSIALNLAESLGQVWLFQSLN